MEIGHEDWWIIPTSGHRAYPYWETLLEDAFDWAGPVPPMPPDLPEHYEVSAAPKGKGSKTNGRDLLAKLGLIEPEKPTIRRGW